MKIRQVSAVFAGIAIAASLALLVSGRRVLIWETKVTPGDRYVISEYGDLGAAQQASLVCRYYTGRSVLTSVHWYSSNGLMGKDQCPFLVVES